MISENTPVESRDNMLLRLLRHAFFDLPSHYTPRTFLIRTVYHFFVYSSLLLSAILLVMFIYHPFEAGILFVTLIGMYELGSGLVLGNSTLSEILARVALLFTSASYIFTASVLWKAISDGTLRLFGS